MYHLISILLFYVNVLTKKKNHEVECNLNYIENIIVTKKFCWVYLSLTCNIIATESLVSCSSAT